MWKEGSQSILSRTSLQHTAETEHSSVHKSECQVQKELCRPHEISDFPQGIAEGFGFRKILKYFLLCIICRKGSYVIQMYEHTHREIRKHSRGRSRWQSGQALWTRLQTEPFWDWLSHRQTAVSVCPQQCGPQGEAGGPQRETQLWEEETYLA